MDNYWETFWTEHTKSTRLSHPQRQVLRTLNKKPVNTEQFQAILKDIDKKLDVLESDVILDLCCGNGIITRYIATKCKRVVGVDFTLELITRLIEQKHQNIETIIEDIRKVDFDAHSFDKVIIYAGLQYLSPGEVIHLFESILCWLCVGGLFFIGDILDRERLWNFFNISAGEYAYFSSVKENKSLLGTWFDAEWLTRLGNYVGFNESEILQQPENLPYSHYRFDMIFKRINV